MRAFRIDFGDNDLVDLTEQADYEFPHPIQATVMPLIVTYSEGTRALGSCFMIGRHLLVTARHVLADVLDDLIAGDAALAAIYTSAMALPGTDGPFGGPLPVKHISYAADPGQHDLALLTVGFPYQADGSPIPVNLFTLSFEPPKIGDDLLVLGYSEMTAELDRHADTPALRLQQKVRASQGHVETLHVPARDIAMLSFPVLEGGYRSPSGMSGGPVIANGGQVCGVVCTGFDLTDGPPTSYASLLAPLLGLSADPTLSDPPQLRLLPDLIADGWVPTLGL